MPPTGSATHSAPSGVWTTPAGAESPLPTPASGSGSAAAIAGRDSESARSAAVSPACRRAAERRIGMHACSAATRWGTRSFSAGSPCAIAQRPRGLAHYRHGRLKVIRAGRANIRRTRPPSATDHMRIASVAKAFSGAVALRLVRDGRLRLDDTIGRWLAHLPAAWAGVTRRQLLDHTSGMPDYTRSKGFAGQLRTNPRGFVSPTRIVAWVRADPLAFAPGSRYA